MAQAAAVGAALVGGGLQAYGSIKAGKEEAKASAFEQQQTALQAEQFVSRSEFEQQQFETSTGYGYRQFRFTEEERQRLFKVQAQELRTAQAQAETARREELTSSLETIMAIRAGRGVGEGSPTGMAIANKLISDTVSDIRTERVGYMSAIDELRRGRQISKTQVRMARQNRSRRLTFRARRPASKSG
jgi:hypothetical protein